MPALSVLEITHNRSAPTTSRAPCVAVKNTTFSCASQKRLKRTPKLIFIHMPSRQVMRHKELAFPFTQSNNQRCVSGKTVTIFCDGGLNTTYMTHQTADRIKAKKLNKFTLHVITMGNVEKTYNTRQYQFTLRIYSGKKVSVTVFGMDRITGPVTKVNISALATLFPTYDPESLQRETNRVDILLGCDYFGFFPKYEEAMCGENLRVIRGKFGVCLQGAHPDLVEQTEYDSNLIKTIENSAN